MKTTLLHNPGSGYGRYSKDQLLKLLRESGYDPTYREMDDGFEEMLEGDPGGLVVVAGGDGTVGRVAKALVKGSREASQGPLVGVLPLGTANNTARHLGWHGGPEDIIPAWAEAQPQPYDLGVAEGPWGEGLFLEAAGLGLFPETMSHIARLKGRREDRLDTPTDELAHDLDVMGDALAEQRAERFRLALDGEDLSGEYFMVEAMNAPAIGPRLHLDPQADSADGFFEVVMLTEDERPLLVDYLQACSDANDRGGRLPDPPRLSARRGRHLRIDWRGQPFHADSQVWAAHPAEGDKAAPAEAPAPVELHLRPSALQFLANASR